MELFWYKIIWKGLDVGLGQNRCLTLKILNLQSLIDVHFDIQYSSFSIVVK